MSVRAEGNELDSMLCAIEGRGDVELRALICQFYAGLIWAEMAWRVSPLQRDDGRWSWFIFKPGAEPASIVADSSPFRSFWHGSGWVLHYRETLIVKCRTGSGISGLAYFKRKRDVEAYVRYWEAVHETQAIRAGLAILELQR